MIYSEDTVYTIPKDFQFKLLAANIGEASAKTPVFTRRKYSACTVEYIQKGHGHLHIDGEDFELGPGDVYFLEKGKDHEYWPDRTDPWCKLFFVIDGAMMTTLMNMYKISGVYAFLGVDETESYFREMLALPPNNAMTDRQSFLIFHKLVNALAEHIYPSKTKGSPILQMLKRDLDSALKEKFSLADYAKGKDLSEAHLIRIFHAEYGISPYDYLMTQKIEQAKHLLIYSNFSVKEIADTLAFSDQYYFSNFFKAKCGCSPKAYKNKSLKK